jgi:hypothetical protein
MCGQVIRVSFYEILPSIRAGNRMQCCSSPVVPGVASIDITFDLGKQVAFWHDFHHKQGLLGLNAGTQRGDDVGVATRLQDHYLLNEALLLGRGGAAHYLDGHIRGSKQHSQVN